MWDCRPTAWIERACCQRTSGPLGTGLARAWGLGVYGRDPELGDQAWPRIIVIFLSSMAWGLADR